MASSRACTSSGRLGVRDEPDRRRGLLYVFDPEGSLNVYSPTTGRKLISLPAGSGHWNSPIAVGGRVILPVGNANDHSTSGVVDIYHLPGH